MEKMKLLLGGHMTTSNGLDELLVRAESLGFTVVQLYTHSDEAWVKHEMGSEDIEAFRKTWDKSSIEYVIAVDPYMKHLGKPDLERTDLMNQLLIDELALCELLGIQYLILHPGTCNPKSSTTACIMNISDNLNEILGQTTGKTKILLQNMASGGKSICYSFENLAWLYRESLHKERLGICFDMCNAFASGYSFGTPDEYEKMWQEFDNIIGLPQLKAIHINDSAEAQGSNVNSHAFICRGMIPKEAYRLIMNDKRFFDIPKVIEIPVASVEDYKKAFAELVDFISPTNKQLLGIK